MVLEVVGGWNGFGMKANRWEGGVTHSCSSRGQEEQIRRNP